MQACTHCEKKGRAICPLNRSKRNADIQARVMLALLAFAIKHKRCPHFRADSEKVSDAEINARYATAIHSGQRDLFEAL